jgi:uncharacterized membrane protein
MAPLIVLLAVFIVSLITVRIVKKEYRTALAARIALSVMLVFTASGHFMYTEGMEMMIPSFIPFRRELVIFTAFIEIAAAIGLHIKKYRRLTAWLLILFFIAVLPANINAAIEGIDYTTGTYNGDDTSYLWFRVPLQLLFILWTYFSSIKLKIEN